MIIGTSGHIDHGKTSLIRALTGVETDRLPEEKKRGISISLGYAYLTLNNGHRVGFVDVPGHEKLIHTMVAGATGMDAAMLVVAADDGVMPQTLEHITILKFLGVSQLIVVLTKVDLVDERRCQDVSQGLMSLIQQSGFDNASLFRINTQDPQHPGLTDLLVYLESLSSTIDHVDTSKHFFRLPVDRVFSLAGIGTIVTGTVQAGVIAKNDRAVIEPGHSEVRVRGIHTQDEPSEQAYDGQRSALNLAGVDKDAIDRGQVVTLPGAVSVSQRFDIRLMTDQSIDTITPWLPVHIHLGTAHTTANLVPLKTINGSDAFVQVVTAQPLVMCAGDRLIIRNASASETIAGGVVLDPNAPTRKRSSEFRISYLESVLNYLQHGSLNELLALSPNGISNVIWQSVFGQSFELTTWPTDAIRLILSSSEQVMFACQVWQTLQQRVIELLNDYHQKMPDEPGIETGRIKRMLALSMPDNHWREVLNQFKQLALIDVNGVWWHLPDHKLTLSPQEEAIAQRILSIMNNAYPEPSWVRDLTIPLNMQEQELRSMMLKLRRLGWLEQVVNDLFYTTDAIKRLLSSFNDLEQLSPIHRVEVIPFKESTGLGRKRAIQILEYFDRVGYTRRVKQGRYLLTPV